MKNSVPSNSFDSRKLLPGYRHGKPYNLFGDYLQDKYNTRVFKLPIDAGFSCPNRDGTTGSDGCIFCCEDGSASPIIAREATIEQQLRNAKAALKRADSQTRYIAYFQAFTNTYAPIEVLRDRYASALRDRDIIGLMIGTRPDCLPDEVLDLIAGYRRDGFELWLEIGMQTAHDSSLGFLKRGHHHEDTRSAIYRASQRGISVCVHVIIGIPGETWNDIMFTANEVSSMNTQGVKIHHLHIIRGTRLEQLYRNGAVNLLTSREYVSTVCDFIERLRGDITVHRLLGDRDIHTLVAPKWGMNKGTVIKEIDEEFLRRGTCQGFLV